MTYNINDPPVTIVDEPVQVFIRRAYCKKCGRELTQNEYILTSDPPQYSYHCNNCNISFYSREQFPEVMYRDREVNNE